MLTPARLNVGRIAASTLPLLAICTMSLSAGCASGGRARPEVPQPATGSQRAGVTPGSWDKVAALRPGSQVVVTVKGGDRLEGAFRALTPGELSLTDPAGRDLSVARSDIGQIVAQGEDDDLANGALIGAGIGLGTAVALLAVLASGDGYVLSSAKWGAPLMLSVAGAVVGVFVDRARSGDRVLYVTP